MPTSRIVSTVATRDAMKSGWDDVITWTRKAILEYPQLAPDLPDTVFPGEFTLQGGRVQAIYTGPSHTHDGIFVVFPEEKVLYGGCILKEHLGNLDFADVAEYANTLRTLKQRNLDFTTIIAGHYSPIHGPELIDQYIELLTRRPQ